MLAVLSQRHLVPEIWLPDPLIRSEREQARSRLHLVKHKSMLKHRIHSTLMSFGHPCPVSDLFGLAGRELLESFQLPRVDDVVRPRPWVAALHDPRIASAHSGGYPRWIVHL